MKLPERVTIYEVGPRDGLQSIGPSLSTETKVAFVDALSKAGLPAIEVTSFVSPRWVPQLSDGAAVMGGITRKEGVRYAVLVPNEKGLEGALASAATEVAVFTAASETFNRKNVNAGIAESLDRFVPVVRRAKEAGLRVRGYVSMAFGCPHEGDIPVAAVSDIVSRLLDDLGCDEVSVGDTLGIADPLQVEELVATLAARFPLPALGLHLHDTQGRGLANVLAGLQAGITTFDSSAGGLGGCPYAPGASGNLATEDLVAMLDHMGIESGVDLELLVAASLEFEHRSGLDLNSKALAARRPSRT